MKEEFFPPLCFDDDERHNAFIVAWYARHLSAMQEPSLWQAADDARLHCYRFLWLRTFHQPVTVRLSVEAEGSGDIVLKITDGMGGYGAGSLRVNQQTRLTAQNTADFLAQLHAADFWHLPTKENKLALDGAQWILEGVKEGEYRLVDRWSPQAGAFRDTAMMMIRLAGLTVENVY